MKTSLIFIMLLFTAQAWSQQLAEQARIKDILEGHTRACMDKDAERAISYFANSPYLAISYQEPGSGYIRGYEQVCETYRRVLSAGKQEKDVRKLYTSEYQFKINGQYAWVTFAELLVPDNGGESEKVFKACYLEKIDHVWKIIGNYWMAEMKVSGAALVTDQY
ncbi:hypothetical protein WJR50_32590 [Catalinimonas sp. 4WD22]|uniref:hypothetical protein n=1 Tax=Catalinimonas locisalis TaxID=3133978 RepID=UPI003101A4F4